MKKLATAQSIVFVIGLLASAARAAPPHDSAQYLRCDAPYRIVGLLG